mmetsp:Transcript_14133/g.42580  ORF Transcript_14133/g.42580 Transcript_14133/m.42580 type:complete len:1025 (-) Transcript_14133:43-3117(-)|eukprot:CAMPEP_0177663416 /NCGR_PEP_ID=MMETSP0447-20121125/19899_1 /TAXON_ID=0 /ORGANISM="Stygamoeba regulata, Strain BSH-02190019" /LENGTH=1024 /DNA_ID=CAMNT_0019169221 /DNA_START=92 /DNA_END=3166 /DNA_ORIENTATION=-
MSSATVPQAPPQYTLHSTDKGDLEPMFEIDLVDFAPNENMLQMVVSGGCIVIALVNGHIIRLDLSNPQDLEYILIGRSSSDSIHKVFLDPLGKHLLVSMENGENYYLHAEHMKPKPIARMKNVVVESVAWNPSGDQYETKEILVGDSNGVIWEASFNRKSYDTGFYAMFHMDKQRRCPVVGLWFTPAHTQHQRYVCVALSRTQLFQFYGGPTLRDMFHAFAEQPDFISLPGEGDATELEIFEKPDDDQQGGRGAGTTSSGASASGGASGSSSSGSASLLNGPVRFAVTTEMGLFHGELSRRPRRPSQSHSQVSQVSLSGAYSSGPVGDRALPITRSALLPFPSSLQSAPTSLLVTEFHFLLLYPERFVAINRLTTRVVYEERIVSKSAGRLLGLYRDPLDGTVWVYAEKGVFELIITRENRQVWLNYLEMNQFDDAFNHCQTAVQRDTVWQAQGNHYLAQGDSLKAASYFGRTTKPLEDVALKFMNTNNEVALRLYLSQKLQYVPRSDRLKCTMLATWITELYIKELNRMPDGVDKNDLEAQFGKFLQKNSSCLHRKTTMHMLTSNADLKALVGYSKACEEYEDVILYYLNQPPVRPAVVQSLPPDQRYPVKNQHFLEAVNCLGKQRDPELFYKYANVLMSHVPKETVDSFIAAGKILDPAKLIPALVRFKSINNPPDCNVHQTLRYLEFAVQTLRTKSEFVHNYIVEVLSKEKNDVPLLSFLNNEPRYYSMAFALRTLLAANQKTACVLVYGYMGCFDEAVSTALSINLELAIFNADQPKDHTVRKTLWMQILKFALEKGGVRPALAIVNKTKYLQIDDLLPLLPDEILIEEIAKDVKRGLEEYGKSIEHLRSRMKANKNSAKEISNELEEAKQEITSLEGISRCAVSNVLLTADTPIYAFRCGHHFSTDALTKEVWKHLSNEDRARVKELRSQIECETPKSDRWYSLRDELDRIVANECYLCGTRMIDSIVEPFFNPDEDQSTWEIKFADVDMNEELEDAPLPKKLSVHIIPKAERAAMEDE